MSGVFMSGLLVMNLRDGIMDSFPQTCLSILVGKLKKMFSLRKLFLSELRGSLTTDMRPVIIVINHNNPKPQFCVQSTETLC